MTHPISLMNLQYYISSKVKNYNLNVIEFRDSDFKNAFPGIFNFTVEIQLENHRFPKFRFWLGLHPSSRSLSIMGLPIILPMRPWLQIT